MSRATVTIFVPDGYADAGEFLKDCQFERAEPSSAQLSLADELQRLCCAETEGKFFDRVTDNIDNILFALRSSPSPEQTK
jgi:hypothetical protein